MKKLPIERGGQKDWKEGAIDDGDGLEQPC